ncbi:MAG: AMP-binding protein [Actinomycetota bacterium]|nr:AMP-binding protein [Actinomycetota bacterium]
MSGFTLADLVRENARSYPLREAVACSGERLTFAEFDARVNGLAAVLGDAKVRRGDRVLWLAQNCHRALEMLFACAKLGAVFVPANWRQAAEEMAFVIEDSQPRLAVWQEAEIGQRVAAARAVAGRDTAWLRIDELGTRADEEPAEDIDEDAVIVQMYTAAFEGRPRGAQLSHRNLVTSSLQHAFTQRYGWDDVHLASMPFFHVLGLLNAVAIFHVGALNVVVRRSDPEEISRLISAERVTRAILIGPTVGDVIRAAEHHRHDLSSLRTIPGGGGADAERWSQMTTPDLPPMGGYGQTELAGQVTYDAYGPRGEGSHGHAAPLAVVRIVGEEGDELSPGEAGEIVVRGPQIMRGYAGVASVGEWRHTGDLGRREADGSITFIGPKTELIKTGAENVYPAEVEAALARHPAVKESCVFGVSDPVWRKAVKAVVVLRDGESLDAPTLIDFCKEHIASYKKPRDIQFVTQLPRAASGTIDRDEVKRLYGG